MALLGLHLGCVLEALSSFSDNRNGAFKVMFPCNMFAILRVNLFYYIAGNIQLA